MILDPNEVVIESTDGNIDDYNYEDAPTVDESTDDTVEVQF